MKEIRIQGCYGYSDMKYPEEAFSTIVLVVFPSKCKGICVTWVIKSTMPNSGIRLMAFESVGNWGENSCRASNLSYKIS